MGGSQSALGSFLGYGFLPAHLRGSHPFTCICPQKQTHWKHFNSTFVHSLDCLLALYCNIGILLIIGGKKKLVRDFQELIQLFLHGSQICWIVLTSCESRVIRAVCGKRISINKVLRLNLLYVACFSQSDLLREIVIRGYVSWYEDSLLVLAV